MGEFKPFKNRFEGFALAKKTHLCTGCRHYQMTTFKACPKCGVTGARVYMRSETELRRAQNLLFLQDQGRISELKLLPKYQLIVNEIYLWTYEADAEYIDNGELVTEDSKGRSKKLKKGYFQDRSSILSIKLFEAIYGRKVRINF